MTVPVIFKINTDIPNNPNDNDAFQVVARVNEYENRFQQTTGVISKILFFIHPLRIFDLYNYLLFFHLIFKEPIAYNVMWLLSFVFGAYSCYLLVNYLVKSKLSAFISGLVYAFSPFHFAHANRGHYGATHIEFIPLFILFLLKFIKKPNLTNLILLGFFFGFLVGGEPHYAAFILIFLIILFVYLLTHKETKLLIINKTFLKYAIVTGIICIGFLSVFYLPLLKVNYSENNYLKPPLSQVIKHSSDALGVITPSREHLLFGKIFEGISSSFTDTSPYIGFTILFFVIIAIIYKRKNLFFWILIALIFYIFSLGPFLHLNGLIKPLIPMPYTLLYNYFPWFDNIRTVERMNVIFVLAIAILAGCGIKTFIARYRDRYKFPVISIITFFVLFEYLIIPIDTNAIEMPRFYKEIASKKEKFAILQIPGSTNYAFASKALYYKSIHAKEVIDGIDFARKIPGRWDFQYKTPVINSLLYSLPQHGQERGDIIKHPYKEISDSVLNYYDIKYILLDKNYIGDKWDKINVRKFKKIINFIDSNIKNTKISDDSEAVIYEIEKRKPSSCFITLGENWSKSFKKRKKFWRWMENNSTIKIINPTKEDKIIELNLTVKSDQNNYRRLEVLRDNDLVGNFIIGPSELVLKLFLKDLKPGDNIVEFKIYDEYNNLIEVDKDTNNFENKENKEDGSEILKKDNNNTIAFYEISYRNIDNIIVPEIINKITQSREEFNIVSVPVISIYTDNNDQLEKYSINGKNLINLNDFETKNQGIVDIKNEKYYTQLPLFKELLFKDKKSSKLIYAAHDIINPDSYIKSINAALSYKNVKYVVFYKEFLMSDFIETIKDNFSKNSALREFYNDSTYLIYEFNNVNNDNLIVYLDGDWGKRIKLDKKSNLYAKNIASGSKIKIINTSNIESNIQVSFKARTCKKDEAQFIKTYFNNNLVKSDVIANKNHKYKLDLLAKPGENEILFELSNKKEETLDIKDFCLAQISNLNIVHK
jgi:hypothetical protein